MADNTIAIIIAVVMAIILLGTGAAAQIIGTFTSAFGWILGGIIGICLILAIIFAAFDKR